MNDALNSMVSKVHEYVCSYTVTVGNQTSIIICIDKIGNKQNLFAFRMEHIFYINNAQ